MARLPSLLSVVQSVEARIGPKVEDAAHSEALATILATTLKARSRARRAMESTSRSVLHSLNIPTASDVRRINRRLAGMERTLEGLAHDEEQHGVSDD